EPCEALGKLLRRLGIRDEDLPTDVDERAALYRSVTSDERVLVLLDNAAGSEQVRPLLLSGAGCLALITSRQRLTDLDQATTVTLPVMAQAEAIAMFTTAAGRGFTDSESADVEAIVELCGRLPLAIRVA